MSSVRKARTAFTLVELMVVVAIIALLIAILLPVLRRARMEADRVVCMSNIRQLGTGVLLYCQENDGYFPTPAYPALSPPGWVWMASDWVHWQIGRNLTDSAIARYVSGTRDAEHFTRLLRCPADRFDGRLPLSGAASQGAYLYSYALSAYVAVNYPAFGNHTKITMWRSPAKKVLMSECMDQHQRVVNGHTFRVYPGASWHIAQVMSQRHGTVVFKGHVPGNPLMERGLLTGTKASTFFMDGHVEPIEQEFSLDPRQMQSHPWDE